MAKKYYWLKLKEDFFEEKQIRYLRKLPDGDKLVIAYLKMQLKSLRTEGFIKYDQIMPNNEEELAMILDEDINIIKLMIQALIKVKAIEVLDDGSFYLIAMQDLVGKEGESAERVRRFRERQKEEEIKMLEELKQPKTNAQRQRQFRAKKNCEQKQHIPYIEDYINNKRYNGNYYIVIQRDKYKCAICGSIENLCVHHIDGYDEKDFTKSNENKMITLCRNCHSNIHAGNKIDEDILNSIDYYEESNEMLPSNANVTKCNTEIEKEKEIKKELDIEKEIDVEENSASADIKNKLQEEFVCCIGSTNLNAIMECLSYLDDLPFEVIQIALKKTADVNGNWKYAKAILNKWVKEKIDTVEKVKTEELNFKKGKQPTVETEEEKMARKIKSLEEAFGNGD